MTTGSDRRQPLANPRQSRGAVLDVARAPSRVGRRERAGCPRPRATAAERPPRPRATVTRSSPTAVAHDMKDVPISHAKHWRTLLVCGIVLLLAVGFGLAADRADKERRALYGEQQSLGLKVGCNDDYPIPASNQKGEAGCWARSSCSFWRHPSCDGLALDAGYLSAWEELEERRDVLESQTVWFAGIAILVGYAVLGWFAHGLAHNDPVCRAKVGSAWHAGR